jgi:tRNA(Ile)-lysidine synthase
MSALGTPETPDQTVARVRAAIAARLGALAEPGRPLLVLLSGGRDSVCLLDALVALRGAAGLRALHVNYGLREGADGDERHCRRLCHALDVGLQVVSPRSAERPAGNLQAWARDQRYAAAARSALADGAVVLTGHTSSDQVETVLYRLAASPGRRALRGMSPRDGRLARPLLDCSRADTETYCRARSLAWREDPSNDSDLYARGRVRHSLLPALRSLHPEAEANVLRTVGLLRDEAEVLDDAVTRALGGAERIAIADLAALPPALARLIVVRLAEDAGGTLLPAAGTRVPELLRLGARGGSAALDLGGGVRAIVEYGVLRMSAQPEDPVPGAVALAMPGRVRFGRWEVTCTLAGSPAPAEGVLDADTLGEELLVRAWRPGDRMAPFGRPGTPTLADLFTDRRVARARRRTIPVVETQGTIAWVPGVATGARFAVTEHTRAAVRLTARPLP